MERSVNDARGNDAREAERLTETGTEMVS